MNIILARIEEYLHSQYRKRPWLAKRTGISLSTLNSWYAVNRPPKAEQLMKISEAIGRSLDWLCFGEKQSMDIDNREILTLFSSLPAHHQDTVRRLMEDLSEKVG